MADNETRLAHAEIRLEGARRTVDNFRFTLSYLTSAAGLMRQELTEAESAESSALQARDRIRYAGKE